MALSLSLVFAVGASAQQASRTEPVTGLRDNGTGYHALVGARAVTSPGRTIDNATIVIRNGIIQSVERGGTAPAGARVWDLTGLTVYAGFIDSHADLGMDQVPEGGDVGPTHWNPQVRAWFSTADLLQDDEERRQALRSQGFGTALVVPKQGIFRGSASVVNLGDTGVRDRILRPDIAQSIGFQRSFELGGRYPNSAMGTIALMKQTFMDAEWYMRAWGAYEASGRSFLPSNDYLRTRLSSIRQSIVRCCSRFHLQQSLASSWFECILVAWHDCRTLEGGPREVRSPRPEAVPWSRACGRRGRARRR